MKVPGTRRRRGWVLIPNPGLAGQKPRLLIPACHDRSPFLTILCGSCRLPNHVHETQLPPGSDEAEFALRCAYCREENLLPPGYLQGAFERMRADGWIA